MIWRITLSTTHGNNAVKLQEIMSRIMQRIMSKISSALIQTTNLNSSVVHIVT